MIIITLLTENYEGVPPTQEDLAHWADQYGETFPVVSDAERYIHTFGTKRGQSGDFEVGLPSHTLLAPGGEILAGDDDFEEEDIAALFE